ncbi:MAG: heme exporter protein CcmD [Gammaproteobacteria bacterium]
MEFFLHFIKMGGYAAYVWPAYGIVMLVLVFMLFANKKS